VAASDEVTALETQLGQETSELSTSDCTAACKALASILRAADRICELEPGPRCDAARKKADAATRQVREACPDCAIAQLLKDEPPQERAMAPAPAPPPASTEGMPASEARGCRRCATANAAPDAGDLLVFAVVFLAIARGSKKYSRRV
jgi:hypothetical protein